MNARLWINLTFLVVAVLTPGRTLAAAFSAKIEVAIVNDPNFPAITVDRVQQILASAKGTFTRAFGDANLEFTVRDRGDAESYIRSVAGPESACLQVAPARVVRLSQPPSRQVLVDATRYLQHWPLEHVAEFFPDLSGKQRSYEEIAQRLVSRQREDLARRTRAAAPRGGSLWTAEGVLQRSYWSWLCVASLESDADILITNAPIFNDLAVAPTPSSIFRGTSVSGITMINPDREAFGGRTIVASVANALCQTPETCEASMKGQAQEKQLEIFGSYILAHELGHAIYRIPDVYHHDPGCLMATIPGGTWSSDLEAITKAAGPCSKCAPFVTSRRRVFAARGLQEHGAIREAVEELRGAIRDTPSTVEGGYDLTISELYHSLAAMYERLHDRDAAVHAIGEATVRMPAAPTKPSTLELYRRLRLPN
jgi:hypothetical protein